MTLGFVIRVPSTRQCVTGIFLVSVPARVVIDSGDVFRT